MTEEIEFLSSITHRINIRDINFYAPKKYANYLIKFGFKCQYIPINQVNAIVIWNEEAFKKLEIYLKLST